MGNSESTLEKELGSNFPPEKLFGFPNYGNTCYCNAVLQALYFCCPLREELIMYHTKRMRLLELQEQHKPGQPSKVSLTRGTRSSPPSSSSSVSTSSSSSSSSGAPLSAAACLSFKSKATLLSELSSLYNAISANKKRCGIMESKNFLIMLGQENEMFKSSVQQDAHEFFNYTLNRLAEILQEELKLLKASSLPEKLWITSPFPSTNGGTFIHDIFEGILTNETRCLGCDNVSSRDENFLDLSIDAEANASISQCLRNFSGTEMLSGTDKFFCNECSSLQEAQKRMRFKKLPKILVVHLKRFKYIESQMGHVKLLHRNPFPLELKIPNTIDEAAELDNSYELFAIVTHLGYNPNRGHYIALAKVHDQWLQFDDENVDRSEPQALQDLFGIFREYLPTTTACGYLLFYQKVPHM